MKANTRRRLVATRGALLLLALAISALPHAVANAAGDPAANCHIGAYRLADDSIVDIDAADEATDLRWRREDGTTRLLTPHPGGTWTSTVGWTGRADGITVRFSDCLRGGITFGRMKGSLIAFDITNTTRLDTRNPAGYLDMMGDYIRNGKLRGEYGDAILYRISEPVAKR